jgi:amino acid adenylation domain-containing protein
MSQDVEMIANPRADGECVPDLVEAQVARTPSAVAVVAGDATLTYAELDARANDLAHRLCALGAGPETIVGVCLDRSLELAIALLAILKAGGACLPLDPAYPRARLSFMLDDAQPLAVVTSDTLASLLPEPAPLVRIDLNDEFARTRPPGRVTRPLDIAYVIYTSGSTGVPKGVLLTHAGLVNHHRAAVDMYRLEPGDRVLQFCSLGFDASIEELFPTWAAGATVVFRPHDLPVLGRSWLAWLRAQAISVMNLPTAYWHAWVRDLDDLGERVPPGLRLVVVGGERAVGSAVRTWAEVGGRGVTWFNAYGPTEATCMATAWRAPAGDPSGSDPPIGRPLPNVLTRVVGEAGVAVERGDVGELLIGGVGIARGYLNRPELTGDRFLAESNGTTHVRWYRTGDMVREGPDGVLAFVGRKDDQVKIQGFRVECHEVETALEDHPGVAQAVVVPRQGTQGERLLMAYVVASPSAATPEPRDLRRHLADRLPRHMIPTAFVAVDALPRNPNGKIARDALPSPDSVSLPGGRPEPPGAGTEQRLASVWASVLGIEVDRIGRGDDFFDLGGHSLLAMQVVARIRDDFNTCTPVHAIIEAPTVAELAAVVDAELEQIRTAPMHHTPRPGRRVARAQLPLSLAQEQMWGLEQAADPPGLYNVTALLRLDRPVDEAALCEALRLLVGRHEALRTAFAVRGGRPCQTVHPKAPVDFGADDLSGVNAGGRMAALRLAVAAEDARPFALDVPPLWRARLFHVDAAWSQLAVTLDHLICDGTTAYVFLDELATAYGALRDGRTPALRPLELQPADFAVWQREHLTEPVLEEQVAWWVAALQGFPLGPAVPFDHVPDAPSRRIGHRVVRIDPPTRRRLDELARATGSTVFVVTAAAFASLLSRWSGKADIGLSTTLSGRSRPELDGLIGLFSGIGRIRADVSGDPTFAEVVARTSRFVFGMYEHQDVPFMRVRKRAFPDFPTSGPEIAAALPVEFQYFRTSFAERSPGAAFVHAGAGCESDRELFFRGQLHPLSLTLLDDGVELHGTLSFKLDFYDETTIERLAAALEHLVATVASDPSHHVSTIAVETTRLDERHR